MLKDKAKTVATEEVGNLIAKRIPADKQEEFAAKWDESPEAGVKFAAEAIGIDKLAEALESADEQNAALAAELRARGAEGLRDLWIQIAIALAGAGGTLFGLKKSSTLGKILSAVVKGIQGYVDTSGNGAELKKSIKTEAQAAGVKPKLDQAVAKVVKG